MKHTNKNKSKTTYLTQIYIHLIKSPITCSVLAKSAHNNKQAIIPPLNNEADDAV